MSDTPTIPVPLPTEGVVTGEFPADVVELLSRIEDLLVSMRLALVCLTAGFALFLGFCVVLVVWFMHGLHN